MRCAGELADDRYQEFDRDEPIGDEAQHEPTREEAAENGSSTSREEAVEEPPPSD